MTSPGGKSAKRLNKELSVLTKKPLSFCTVEVVGEGVLDWIVTINGPIDTPYEGGRFKVSFKFSENYPIKPPAVAFVTRIYHPNVSMKDGGSICQEIIGTGDQWSPVLKASYVIEKVHKMLEIPDGQTPLEAEIGELFNTDIKKFNQMAKQITKKHAS